jgi:predicted nucleic acid-binding protein
MNIYCETNFFLEVVFFQEQANFCEKIFSLCKKKKVRLIIPAYSLAESIYRLESQAKIKKKFQEELDAQINHFSRTAKYSQQTQNFKNLGTFLDKTAEDEQQNFEKWRKNLVRCGEFIPFDKNILKKVKAIEAKYDLTLPDAIVFTSILSHLQNNKSLPSCFLNRNAKDFNTSEIKTKLRSLNCKLIPSFADGFKYISNQIK